MIGVIAVKDLKLARRQALLPALLVVCLLLLAVALLAGIEREADFARERAAAAQTDREVWMGQGDRNPHSAAHFSRYAFRPSSPLALLDPGITDFAGVAVWMEAHFHNPAVFRRAEDGGELSRFAQLSPAQLFLVALPLLIFVALHGAIAGEREDGTLQQLVASGVSFREFLLGKLGAGLRLVVPVFLMVFVLTALLALLTTPASVGADAIVRLGAALLLYLIYAACCIAIAVAVSALFAARRSALLALVALWAVSTVLVPRLAVDAAASLYAPTDSREVVRELRAASDTYYADKDRRQKIEAEVLERYGVASIEALPIDYGAYVLQVSEELSIPEFERVYGALRHRHDNQNAAARAFGLLSPLIPAANLSRGFAGTDLLHQSQFLAAAERHRREMIKMLNEDYMFNAGELGYGYTADATLWERFEDFAGQPQPLTQSGRAYLPDLLLMMLWLAAALAAAYLIGSRAFRQALR